ncbi:uncharacterized protein [Leptinotarsa decemlineata]|uniref:uncharacterized protein n=1 Tax=Leptinotarsa decemlineata TaxID=7539 RepID=UPI003D307019
MLKKRSLPNIPSILLKFITVLQLVRCSKENPVLMVLDNHESHLSISVLNFCKENGVILSSFTPHTSHKLQPLDRTVFGPLKRHFNGDADAWLRSNLGKVMNIYDIPTVLKDAFPLAATPINIKKGFFVTGIWPFNREIFLDDEFLPAEITNRSITENINARVDIDPSPICTERHITPSPQQPSTSTYINLAQNEPVDLAPTHLSPQEVKPYTKAMARKSKKGRKKRTFAVLTDTPIKAALEEEQTEIQRKRNVGATKKTYQVNQKAG